MVHRSLWERWQPVVQPAGLSQAFYSPRSSLLNVRFKFQYLLPTSKFKSHFPLSAPYTVTTASGAFGMDSWVLWFAKLVARQPGSVRTKVSRLYCEPVTRLRNPRSTPLVWSYISGSKCSPALPQALATFSASFLPIPLSRECRPKRFRGLQIKRKNLLSGKAGFCFGVSKVSRDFTGDAASRWQEQHRARRLFLRSMKG